jgi:hypothetical protein
MLRGVLVDDGTFGNSVDNCIHRKQIIFLFGYVLNQTENKLAIKHPGLTGQGFRLFGANIIDLL